MKTLLRGNATVEVMTLLVALSMVLSVSYAGKAFAQEQVLQSVHRDRAQLYAQETFAELDVIRSTREQQDAQRSWQTFLGGLSDGMYQIVRGERMNMLTLLPLVSFDAESSELVREYRHLDEALENTDGIYTRLERRIFLKKLSDESVLVTVSIYWGLPGQYRDDHSQHIRLQRQYFDQVRPVHI